MADDIFLSPEEQDERAKQWLKDNGIAIAVGIALGFGAIFGYNHYKEGLISDAEQAAGLFSVVIDRVDNSESADVSAQVDKLKQEFPSTSYASKAALISAKQNAVNDLDEAYKELQWVVDNAPESGLVHTARIRQAKIKLSMGDLDSVRTLTAPASYDGFDSHYNELLGDAEVQAGNVELARTHYQSAIESLSSSDAAYSRILTLKLDRLPSAPKTEG